jgi:transaldolase
LKTHFYLLYQLVRSTLVFGFCQAVAAAQAGVYLISPFPGRILDWHKKQTGVTCYAPMADPGVLAVQRMYQYFKKYNYNTICMPASWRPSRGSDIPEAATDEILALAGCDEMTIPPGLLERLMDSSDHVTRYCVPAAAAATCTDPNLPITEEIYRDFLAADGCVQDKLAEGIDAFTVETRKLEEILIARF